MNEPQIEQISVPMYRVAGREFRWKYEAESYAQELAAKSALPTRPMMEQMANHGPLRGVLTVGSTALLMFPLLCASTWHSGPYGIMAVIEQVFVVGLFVFNAMLAGHYTQARYDKEHTHENL